MKIFLSRNSVKKIIKLEEQNKKLEAVIDESEGQSKNISRNLKGVGISVMPGYVLLRKFDKIGKSNAHKKILTNYTEIYGKKNAGKQAKHLLAKLISFFIIGVGLTFILGVIIMVMGYNSAGLSILTIGTSLIVVLIYAMYDDVKDKANKRREAIVRQFPNVVSKLALLVSSGMIMDRAWKETAYSQNLELYKEMQKTSRDLENNVRHSVAFDDFIKSCSTKETAKLASAIIQNLSKGNAEIGRLLKDLAKEAWQERRHMVKRDSEKANSKLMIPTMMLFIAILVMIMVPIAITFSEF